MVYAIWIGKAAQATTVSGLILCFFADVFNGMGFPLHLIVIWCAVALTLTALFIYGRSAVRKYKEAGRAQNG